MSSTLLVSACYVNNYKKRRSFNIRATGKELLDNMTSASLLFLLKTSHNLYFVFVLICLHEFVNTSYSYKLIVLLLVLIEFNFSTHMIRQFNHTRAW